jgi:hypothetical protein
MKHRRGVSEILATMIVLMIVSSLGVMLYNISTSTLSSQQDNLLSQVETQKETTLEKFQIISITVNEGTHTIIIYYLDYGSVSPVFSSVYLSGIGKTPGVNPKIEPPWPVNDNVPVMIDSKPSNIHQLTVTIIDNTFLDNYYVTYKIVSQRGNSSEFQA